MGDPFPQYCPFPRGIRTPMSDTIPWTHRNTQIKRHLYRFSHLSTDDRIECSYTLQWDAHSPPQKKLPLPMGGSEPPSNIEMVPWAHPSPQPKRHLDRFSRFCRAHKCDRQTDRQTDHATRSLTIDRIYVRSTAIRSNNNNKKN